MDDPAYPSSLRDTPDPPLFLYVKGMLKPEDRNAVAIVGTRKPTHYGKTVTLRLAGELAASGFTVISGLARGIDTQAHRGALTAGGRTIAVLGCGIDVAYPPENRDLMEKIGKARSDRKSRWHETGVRVISRPGIGSSAALLADRDHRGVGRQRTLITAQYSLDPGRKLFAVPGNIGSPVSRGTHSLIKEGDLVEGTEDILAGLGVKPSSVCRITATRSVPSLTLTKQPC
jgi:DNA processing protein